MPMDKSLYPTNWSALSLAKREEANWTCEECGRPCRKPGVDWMDFVMFLLNTNGVTGWYADSYDESANGDAIERPQRFTLTVSHLDHNPQNCAPENLKALCAPCHLRYDAPIKGAKLSGAKYRRREAAGQLILQAFSPET